MTITRRYAVRVLTPAGRGAAIAYVPYNTSSGRVKKLEGWLIRRSGAVESYGDAQALDKALIDDDLYNESRDKIISAYEDADTGAVFGFESVLEDTPPFTQLEWTFQDRAPALVSRFILSVPPEWSVDGALLNHAALSPSVSQSTYAWEMNDLEPIDEEPESPPLESLAPQLVVSLHPPVGSTRITSASFSTWADVSRWLADIARPSAVPGEAVSARARALVASARTERDSVAKIGRFVQSIRYASIQLGEGRGGGYRPHPAPDVFAKSYGDCKDKANLMLAMLGAVGIQFFLVSVYSGDRDYVRESWASPQQFNHCILAVRLRHETSDDAVATLKDGARLLIFDPTSPYTPLGQIPRDEQGSLALIVAPGTASLLRLPEAPPEANLEVRRTELSIAEDGSATGRIRDRLLGAAAADERGMVTGEGDAALSKRIERSLSEHAAGAVLSHLSTSDESLSGAWVEIIEFSAPRYAQLMQDRLMVFKPMFMSGEEMTDFSSDTRQLPIAIEANAECESVMVQLPAGFAVDERPETVDLKTAFGRYRLESEMIGDRLLIVRKLTMSRSQRPAEEYVDVRAFFEHVRAADQVPVVLIRK